ncbi:hypothetical protein [Kingella oralis]|uniref:hypothetical protein n=1 Tax=Kingella oralis TaxID=505 RepID=UPI0034E479A2
MGNDAPASRWFLPPPKSIHYSSYNRAYARIPSQKTSNSTANNPIHLAIFMPLLLLFSGCLYPFRRRVRGKATHPTFQAA